MTEAELTLFHCMLFLKDWLNFFYLLCQEFYFAFEEGLRVTDILEEK